MPKIMILGSPLPSLSVPDVDGLLIAEPSGAGESTRGGPLVALVAEFQPVTAPFLEDAAVRAAVLGTAATVAIHRQGTPFASTTVALCYAQDLPIRRGPIGQRAPIVAASRFQHGYRGRPHEVRVSAAGSWTEHTVWELTLPT